jgi:ribokinase
MATQKTNQFDFVALGDITTDAFIELKDVTVQANDATVDQNDKLLCVRFGDKIEYEDVVVVPAVGNSPNASVSAHRLGLKSALATNLGDDKFGKEDLETLKKEGVDTSLIKVHKGKKSNYHYVLRYGPERTILVKHWEYEYSLPNFEAPPKWMYLSSLGENSVPFHHELAEYISNNQKTKLAFQPGTFQIKLGYETLKDLYEQTEVFFCNKEEAQRILKTDETEIKYLLHGIQELGPKIVVITDGPNGAYASDDSTGVWQMPMYPDPGPPVDRTGAGDSFSSTFISALALGKDIPTALSWGPINSMNVVQHIGAQAGKNS